MLCCALGTCTFHDLYCLGVFSVFCTGAERSTTLDATLCSGGCASVCESSRLRDRRDGTIRCFTSLFWFPVASLCECTDVEVEKAFVFHLFRQKLDRNRVNCIEVIQKRRGGTIISVLHRFDQTRPRLSDTVHIGPFWNHKEAQAVADAIQAELMPENQDAGQIKQMQKFETQFVSRFVIGCLIVFEMIVGFDFFFKWSRMGPVEWLIAAWMAVVPWIILYSVTREINSVRKANTPH